MARLRTIEKRIGWLLLAIPFLFYGHKPFYWFEALRFDVLHIHREILGYYVKDVFYLYDYPPEVEYSSEYYVFNLCRSVLYVVLVQIAFDAYKLYLLHSRRSHYTGFVFPAFVCLKGFMLFNLFLFVAADTQLAWYLQLYTLIPFLIVPYAAYALNALRNNTIYQYRKP